MLPLSFFENLQIQSDHFMEDLDKEISIRNAEEWNRKIERKKKKKKEMPLDIDHSK